MLLYQNWDLNVRCSRLVRVEECCFKIRETEIIELILLWLVKYMDLTESYKSLSEALIHAGVHTQTKVNIHYFDSEEIEKNGAESLK